MTPESTLAAKLACQDLIVKFAVLNDARDAAGLAELFADDGVMIRPDGSRLEGRAVIAAAYADKPADRLTCHLVANVLVDVQSENEASGTSSVLLWSASAADEAGPFGRPAAARQVVGEFHDRFVKTESGWRIAERRARFTMVRQ